MPGIASENSSPCLRLAARPSRRQSPAWSSTFRQRPINNIQHSYAKATLEEAIAFSKGEHIGARAHIPPEPDVRRIRKKMKLTQGEFAAQSGFNVARLCDRGQGRTQPDAALRACLMVTDRKPEAVREALAA